MPARHRRSLSQAAMVAANTALSKAQNGFMTSGGVVTTLASCWRFECGVAEEHDENQLFRISVPSGDHSPGDLALSPVHAQLS